MNTRLFKGWVRQPRRPGTLFRIFDNEELGVSVVFQPRFFHRWELFPLVIRGYSTHPIGTARTLRDLVPVYVTYRLLG